MFSCILCLHIWFEAIISASFVAAFFRVLWFELFPSLAHVFAFGQFLILVRSLTLACFFVGLQFAVFIYLSSCDYFDLLSSMDDCAFVKSAFWRGSLYFVDLFSAGGLCAVPSIIRAYFVAVFQTARHIINVGARTPTYNQLYYPCLADNRQTLDTNINTVFTQENESRHHQSHMQSTVLLAVLL